MKIVSYLFMVSFPTSSSGMEFCSSCTLANSIALSDVIFLCFSSKSSFSVLMVLDHDFND